MRQLPTSGGLALLAVLAGCNATSDTRKQDKIPEALRGCWTIDDPDVDPVHSERLEIAANTITASASWISEKPFKLKLGHIETISPTTIAGQIEFPDVGGEWAPYATEIGIGIRGAPPGRLVVVEGDAGSRWHSRCGKRERAKT